MTVGASRGMPRGTFVALVAILATSLVALALPAPAQSLAEAMLANGGKLPPTVEYSAVIVGAGGALLNKASVSVSDGAGGFAVKEIGGVMFSFIRDSGGLTVKISKDGKAYAEYDMPEIGGAASLAGMGLGGHSGDSIMVYPADMRLPASREGPVADDASGVMETADSGSTAVVRLARILGNPYNDAFSRVSAECIRNTVDLYGAIHSAGVAGGKMMLVPGKAKKGCSYLFRAAEGGGE